MIQLNILRIDSSARNNGSATRELTDAYLASLAEKNMVNSVVARDTSTGMEFVSEDWIGANFTDESERSEEQRKTLSKSDELVDELKAADLIVIGVPVYNFGVPASLKAWVDMVARARKTFQYTENGPVGLLENKRAVLVVASGGTEVGSNIDFATGYMKHVMGFLGIHDVEVIAADRLMIDAEAAMNAAHAKIAELGQAKAA